MAVLIIGAGPAGLACARTLADAGRAVQVVDKGRGPGGRLSTRRAGAYVFDHGAQYFRIRDPRLTPLLAALRAAGAVAPWRGRLVDLRDRHAAPRHDDATRYVGVPGMSAVVRALAADLPVTYGTRIASLSRAGDGWTAYSDAGAALPGRFAAVVAAVPAAQAVALLAAAPGLASAAAAVEVDPCWAAMVAFPQPLALDFDAAFVDGGPLAWVARNGSKPGRPAGECWVLHGAPAWSGVHVDAAPATAAAHLLDAFAVAAGIALPAADHLAAHRWLYARTRTPLGAPFLFDPGLGLAACGDWCLGATVECALQSGMALGERLAEGAAL